MKCACGYQGIPTAHHEHPDRWKCPACHAPRPTPLRHDPMPPEADGRLICAQCGMWGMALADLARTPCPGHGAHWHLPVAWCLCGEWGPAPKAHGETLACARCGRPYPHYAPPPAPRKVRGDAAFAAGLRALAASGEPITMQGLLDCLTPKGDA